MWRAAAKGLALATLGRLPAGARAYRHLTREALGTQATHVDKLARVLPAYAALWRTLGVELDGARLWFHEGGHTPFPHLASFLLTGRGAVVTNVEARLSDRYLGRAVERALAIAWPETADAAARRATLEPLRWAHAARAAVDATGGEHEDGVRPAEIPCASESVDLCHSGGALEHYPEPELRAFLAECRRVLRPGGLASHVFDHRDHLWHADRRWPYLAHLAWPEPAYRALFGHALGYHNRLAPARVQALFAEAGFERVLVRRLRVPELTWVDDVAEIEAGRPGLPPRLLARAHRGISAADLRTAAAHYLYRRRSFARAARP
jgi:SAM-dependent methyltransferase